MSADLASVNAAREDTKAILANLQKGQILLSTTSKDIKPMNFAWVGPKSGVTALKALSETATKFPVYNLSTLERYESPTKAREAPITYDPTQLTVTGRQRTMQLTTTLLLMTKTTSTAAITTLQNKQRAA